MTKKLTQSLEDYLEAIAELIAVEGHAHTKEIAEKLGVKMPSVTGALRQLVKMNYIVYSTHYPVQLTPEGKRVAEQVIQRHQVLKRFFSSLLGMNDSQASEAACHLEHAIDESVIDKFNLLLDAVSNRSDSSSLRIYLAEAVGMLNDPANAGVTVLSRLHPGSHFEIIKLGSNLTGAELPANFAPGREMTFTNLAIDGRTFRLEDHGETVQLPRSLAENLWVKQLPAR